MLTKALLLVIDYDKQYVPAILDIEASGFGQDSYPIEIGFVRSDGFRFCSLIKPFDEWTHWNEDAEQVHGITRSQLDSHGMDGQMLCHVINELLSGTTIYSDGWVVDSPWLTKLFNRAQVKMTFRLSAIEMIMKEKQLMQWDAQKKQTIETLNISRHRASNDALIIQNTYLALQAVKANLAG